jgi:hypothetical protein
MISVEQAIASAECLLPGDAAPDGELDARWQAIIAVGAFAESRPDEVWAFARRWGAVADEDLRMAVATCLLEHLLAAHFDAMFPRVRAAAREDACFADAVCSVWRFGASELASNAAALEALKTELRTRVG